MKARYKRILALVDPDWNGRATAREASRLATRYRASLALGHIPDGTPDEGPEPMVGSLVDDLSPPALTRIREMAERMGLREKVSFLSASMDRSDRGLAEMIGSWQPDLVVVQPHNRFGLVDGQELTIKTPLEEVTCAVHAH